MTPFSLNITYLVCFAMYAAKTCCAGVVAARFIPLASSWNRSCIEHTGRSWLQLGIERNSHSDSAHPGMLAVFLLLCAAIGCASAASFFDGTELGIASGLAAADWPSRLLWLAIQSVYAAVFSLAPPIMLRRALLDPDSPIASTIRCEIGIDAVHSHDLASALEQSTPLPNTPSAPAIRL